MFVFLFSFFIFIVFLIFYLFFCLFVLLVFVFCFFVFVFFVFLFFVFVFLLFHQVPRLQRGPNPLSGILIPRPPGDNHNKPASPQATERS